MSIHENFFTSIASALDQEGIESRISEGGLYVPVASEVEIIFESIGDTIPAAQIYVSTPADLYLEEESDSAALVGVAFDVESAVRSVQMYISTDQIITVLRNLIDGTDDRLAEVDFRQDYVDPLIVRAEVADNSELIVQFSETDEELDGQPRAQVTFVSFTEDPQEVIDEALNEFWVKEQGEDELYSNELERQRLYQNLIDEVNESTQEVLELGTFTDFNQLFDVLELAAQHARDWEEQLVPLDNSF